MSIFLSVLAVILKILLGILMFLLFVLLVIFFVPIRFSLDAHLDRIDFDKLNLNPIQFGKKNNDECESAETKTEGAEKFLESIHFNAFVHWILYMVRARALFHEESKGVSEAGEETGPKVSLKVLFFTLIPQKEKASEPKSQKGKKGKSRKNKTKEEPVVSEEQAVSSETTAIEEKTLSKEETVPQVYEKAEKDLESTVKTVNEEVQKATVKTEVLKQDAVAQKAENIKKHKTPNKREINEDDSFAPLSFVLFLWRIFGFLMGFINKPYAVFQKFLYTISSIRDKISLVRDLLETDAFTRGKTVLFKQIKRLLKGLSPKKSSVNVGYGAGDPCLTAEILAVYSVFHPLFRGHVLVTPDFEHRMLEAELHLKGRITVFRIVTCLAIVYFNKDIRKVIKRWNYIKNLK